VEARLLLLQLPVVGAWFEVAIGRDEIAEMGFVGLQETNGSHLIVTLPNSEALKVVVGAAKLNTLMERQVVVKDMARIESEILRIEFLVLKVDKTDSIDRKWI
jgi:hypothetical protein